MTGKELTEEGHRLARPCVYLTSRNEGDVIGLWGGPGAVTPPSGPYRHWLSIDCRSLPQNPAGMTGCFSVYTDERGTETGIVTHDNSLPLPPPARGQIPLSGRREMSLPPVDAVFRFGPSEVQEWLATNDWQPGWGYNNNFKGREAVAEYEDAVRAASPLYQDNTYAQLGGWSIPWPEGDWEELLDQTLLVWTLKDAEPWVEVWQNTAGSLRVIQRIS